MFAHEVHTRVSILVRVYVKWSTYTCTHVTMYWFYLLVCCEIYDASLIYPIIMTEKLSQWKKIITFCLSIVLWHPNVCETVLCYVHRVHNFKDYVQYVDINRPSDDGARLLQIVKDIDKVQKESLQRFAECKEFIIGRIRRIWRMWFKNHGNRISLWWKILYVYLFFNLSHLIQPYMDCKTVIVHDEQALNHTNFAGMK